MPAGAKYLSEGLRIAAPVRGCARHARLYAAAQAQRGRVHEGQGGAAVGEDDGVGGVVEGGAPAVAQRRRRALRLEV